MTYHRTRDLVLTYLEVVGEPAPVVAICTYMRRMHRVDAGATRTCLYRLHKQGLVRRLQFGVYQRIEPDSAGREALEQFPPD